MLEGGGGDGKEGPGEGRGRDMRWVYAHLS